MIVSHEHRFIFFAIPKTGTQSIRAALRPLLGAGDWEQADWETQKRAPIAAIAKIEHGHVQVREARPWLDSRIWKDYLKFACVRNPWDRFVSCAFFKNRTRPLFLQRPRAVLKLIARKPGLAEDLFFRPQLDFLTEFDDRMEMDFLIRFENLQADFNEVCRRIGVSCASLPHLNQSMREATSKYFDGELIDEVGRFYARDVQAFGYEYDVRES